LKLALIPRKRFLMLDDTAPQDFTRWKSLSEEYWCVDELRTRWGRVKFVIVRIWSLASLWKNGLKQLPLVEIRRKK
jgi:hypothetical protein